MKKRAGDEELFSVENKYFDTMQKSLPLKMFISCLACCLIAILALAFVGDYILMSVHISILIATIIAALLQARGKITVETACLIPILMLCFLFTPISWFRYDGFFGYTPYVTILFAVMITLTYYRRIQALLLGLYSALLLTLSIYWLFRSLATHSLGFALTSFLGYSATYAILIYFLLTTKRKSKEISSRIMDRSVRDDLTGLFNRRGIVQILEAEERLYLSKNEDFSILMLDVDRFKSINDLYGHTIGDAVLRSIATCILDAIRSSDYAMRYGGDEFLILLSNTKKEVSRLVFERIEAAARVIPGYSFPVTVSIGLAMRSECTTTDETIALADKRMYEDKDRRREEIAKAADR